MLQTAKLKLELRRIKREMMPADEVRRIGAELGSAIRKMVMRVHLLAPSLVDQPTEVVAKRLTEEEAGIVAQVRILDEALAQWRANAGA